MSAEFPTSPEEEQPNVDVLAKLPHAHALCRPVWLFLKDHEGSTGRSQITAGVAKMLQLSADEIDLKHEWQSTKASNNVTKLEYRVGWALTMLKHRGLVSNAAGKWRSTELGRAMSEENFELIDTSQKAFLFSYNPEKYDWTGKHVLQQKIAAGETASEMWRTQKKTIPTGSECYLIQLGKNGRGIIARGHTSGTVVVSPETGKGTVRIDFAEINDSPIISWETLQSAPFNDYHWGIMGSGVQLPINMAHNLSTIWQEKVRPIVDVGSTVNDALKEVTKIMDYAQFVAERNIFVSAKMFEKAHRLLSRKKNIIFEGPPGVGKTFIARHLAELMGSHHSDQTAATVQFHQSYSYEDFVSGYRPAADGTFMLSNGPFVKLCLKALDNPDRPFVIIIDEINRGNLGKILGELLLLIEADKRGPQWQTVLCYGLEGNPEECFFVPENVYIIGTMNTADTSLAPLDYATRRRFCSVALEPAFQEDRFKEALQAAGLSSIWIEKICKSMVDLNAVITADDELRLDSCIGHSFFCPPTGLSKSIEAQRQWLEDIIEYEISPLVREYWSSEPNKAAKQINDLKIALFQ